MRKLICIFSFCWFASLYMAYAQDTTVIIENKGYTLSTVVVRNNMDYKGLLQRIKNDTTFYKAFRNLRVIEYSAYNNITVFDKKWKPQASYFSKTTQHRKNGCRSTEFLEQKTTGDFFDSKGNYNYKTAEMYAGLFFAAEPVCGENNLVKGHTASTKNKSGIAKQKEQLKMLFFNPGKKIPGIPFIGDKLDLYDDRAYKMYDYRLDYVDYKGKPAYLFTIIPKANRKNDVVVDKMETWFDAINMEVVARNYSLSYKAGVYDFDVKMEVQLSRVGSLLVPTVMRYQGNWSMAFKKRERSEFTATLFNFKRGS